MLDLPQFVALAIAWVGAFFSQGQVIKEVATDCHCNCTCEVTQATCPEAASWTYELIKIFGVLLAGVAVGSGYLVKGIFLGGTEFVRWLQPSATTSLVSATTLKVSTASPSPELPAGQRDLAFHQLELVRQRRAVKA